jgi:hypothetical protein
MADPQYSAHTNEAVATFKIIKWILLIWIAACLIYVAVIIEANPGALLTEKEIHAKTTGLVETAGRYIIRLILNGVLVFSAMSPILVMVLSLSFILRTSAQTSAYRIRGLAIFWSGQILYLLHLRAQIDEASLHRFWQMHKVTLTTGYVFLGIVLGVALYRIFASRWLDETRQAIYAFLAKTSPHIIRSIPRDTATRTVYYCLVLCVTALVAFLFEKNLFEKNLAISNGVVCALPIAALLLPSAKIELLLIFAIEPFRYRDIHKELDSRRRASPTAAQSHVVFFPSAKGRTI